KTVINEKEPEGPSYGTTIHLLSDNPPTPTFEEQYVVQANDTHNNGVPSGSPHPIYGMGYPVTNNGTIALKMLSVVTHFKNYGDFSIFKKDTHEYVDWSAVSSRFEFVSSNTSVIDFHEAAGAAAEGNEFWIQGNVGDSTQISIKDRSTGKVVYTFTVNIVN
uniref:hypothetical protein n=1 Tax=Listeria ilorinensis TaxID=2867439 RepID=UPI001EF59459